MGETLLYGTCQPQHPSENYWYVTVQIGFDGKVEDEAKYFNNN